MIKTISYAVKGLFHLAMTSVVGQKRNFHFLLLLPPSSHNVEELNGASRLSGTEVQIMQIIFVCVIIYKRKKN